ncbi:EAL domain-containing protein [Massilia sp. CF038]|uniref:bifunctional diguanylate cyclase/phosphodiesterase n=1 Tax=Massilia sp. CF038 TaxID=1881045 RepID=UPI00091FDE84|nr:EAL domain-containing protein [Massilia sp. CF038]SHG62599.1 diguanylate cyclase/phosphodiesterase [Massilia sp. CF038]
MNDAAMATGGSDATQGTARASHVRRLLCLAICTAIVAIIVTSVLTLLYLRRYAEERVAVTTRNLAGSVVLTIDGVVDSIDLSLLATSDEIARQRASGTIDARAVNQFMLRQQERLHVVPTLVASNARGDVIFGQLPVFPPLNLSQRSYFAALAVRPQRALYMNEPVLGRLSQRWIWPFARRLDLPDGRFGGVVTGALDTTQLGTMLEKIELQPGASIVLRDAHFKAIAWRSGQAGTLKLAVGDSRLSPELQQALKRDAARGTYTTSRSAQSGATTTFSYERSSKYGFYVWVGESNQHAMAGWMRQVGIIAGLTAAFIMLSLGFLAVAGQAARRRARDLQAIEEGHASLRDARQIADLERQRAQDEISRLAWFDELTGLPNRRLLLERVAAAMDASVPGMQHGALLLIDLDHFKVLNDTQGHERGDLLLKAVAQRLHACLNGADQVARMGGDEFAVLATGLSSDPAEAQRQVAARAETVRAALAGTYEIEAFPYLSSPSIGISLFRGQLHSVDELVQRADTAMYQAKAAGRNTVRFFDPATQAAVAARLALEQDLRLALEQQQFLLHYQVQIDSHGQVRGAEVLVRWQHPKRGMVSPGEFIPLAESSGLILPLGHWVLETACAQLAAWTDDPVAGKLSLAVNVSASQFSQPDFVDQVLAVLARSGAHPARLKLELTEGMLLEHTDLVIETINALKQAGIGISLDDFGTGYSSLSYLKRLPLNQLKIDQTFVRELPAPSDMAIVRTIVALGQSLGMEVIAEGVETVAQRDALAAAGCHVYQGYLFGKPVPVARFEEALRMASAASTPTLLETP